MTETQTMIQPKNVAVHRNRTYSFEVMAPAVGDIPERTVYVTPPVEAPNEKAAEKLALTHTVMRQIARESGAKRLHVSMQRYNEWELPLSAAEIREIESSKRIEAENRSADLAKQLHEMQALMAEQAKALKQLQARAK